MRNSLNQLKRAKASLAEYIEQLLKDPAFHTHQYSKRIRDIIIHIAAWDLVTIKALNACAQNHEPGWIEDIDAFNTQAIQERADLPWKKVYREFLQTNGLMLAAYQHVPGSHKDKVIWSAHGITPRGMLHIDISHHNEHLKEIKVLTTK